MAKPTVAIFGGGVAGRSAAHELAERGFAVAVYQRQPVYVSGIFIPLCESWAIWAGRRYQLAPDWWGVPRYIYRAEALLMLPVPALLQLALGRGGRWASLVGLLEGAAMLLACLVALTIAG